MEVIPNAKKINMKRPAVLAASPAEETRFFIFLEKYISVN